MIRGELAGRRGAARAGDDGRVGYIWFNLTGGPGSINDKYLRVEVTGNTETLTIAVPEPGTMLLTGRGILGEALRRRRHRQS